MQTAAARTTSMLASAALLGALAIAGLTMTISFTPRDIIDTTRPVTIEQDPPRTPPPIERPRTPPPPIANTEARDTTLPQDPPQVIDVSTDTGAPWSPPGPATITDPHWLRRPTNLQAYYPRRAIDRGMQGNVVLDCRVSTVGMLDCAVVSEDPAGWGFGQAALRISRDHRMQPAMHDGAPVEGRYRMRVPFRVE